MYWYISTLLFPMKSPENRISTGPPNLDYYYSSVSALAETHAGISQDEYDQHLRVLRSSGSRSTKEAIAIRHFRLTLGNVLKHKDSTYPLAISKREYFGTREDVIATVMKIFINSNARVRGLLTCEIQELRHQQGRSKSVETKKGSL